MKHKKSNEKTEYRGFKYGKCKLLTGLPNSFYEEMKLSKLFWNRLLELHNEYTEARNQFCRDNSTVAVQFEQEYEKAKELYLLANTEFKQSKIKKIYTQELKEAKDNLAKKYRWAWKNLKEERKKIIKELGYKEEIPFLHAARKLQKEFSRLHWGQSEAIINDFINAREKFLRGQGGKPRFKYEDETDISFKIRYTGGGKATSSIYKCNSILSKFWMGTPNENNRAKFYWKFGDPSNPRQYDIMSFEVTIHRPLPEDGKIKSVCLKRDRDEWSLVFGVEEKPVAKFLHGNRVLYFTPRWSVDNIFGSLFMGELFIENEDQIVAQPIHLFDTVDVHKDKAKILILDKLTFLENLNREASKIIDDLKSELSGHINSIQQSTGWEGNLALCNSRGLKKLLVALQKCLPKHSMTRNLEIGLKKYDKKMVEYANSRKRLSRFRKDCYWNFGKKLAEVSKEIYLDKFDFKTLGMKKDIENIPEKVASKIRKHKSHVAHYEFYDTIKKQCHKHGVDVIMVDFRKDKKVRKALANFSGEMLFEKEDKKATVNA